jgi:DNA-directed RNA polymerase I subunit RPA2
MPDGSQKSRRQPTFNTIQREESFKNPLKTGSTYPILNEFVTPHIESFNALFDDSGLPKGDGDGRGLLSLGLKDIGERVVFDGSGELGTESGQHGWGNRLSSKWCIWLSSVYSVHHME